MLSTLLAILAVNPASAQSCSDFVIQEQYDGSDKWTDLKLDSEGRLKLNMLSMGDPRGFRLAASAGAASALTGCDCTWFIDPWDKTKGTLASDDDPKPSDEAGGITVTFFAPEDLLDCQDVDVSFGVFCDGNTAQNFDLTVTPIDADGDNQGEDPAQFSRCSVSGGGLSLIHISEPKRPY